MTPMVSICNDVEGGITIDKNKVILSISMLTLITVVLNLLMMFTFREANEEIFSNIFAIGVTILVFILVKYSYYIENEKSVRSEFYGLLLMFGITVMRFINRIKMLPYFVNGTGILIFIGSGVFLITVAYGRIAKMREKKL